MKSKIRIKLTQEQKERLIALAKGSGFNTISSYVRFVMFNPTFDLKLNRILEIVKDIQEKNKFNKPIIILPKSQYLI